MASTIHTAMCNKLEQKDVIAKLGEELGTVASGIGVSVNDGEVTLSGSAANYTEKYAAERAALHAPGVRVVCESVQVAGPHGQDEEIARAVARALQQDLSVPPVIQATVEDGWVALRGEVISKSQRDAAVDAVRHQAGVDRIYNLITVKPAE